MTRKLIINADDFGLTPGVNSAVAECFDRGLLRSATVMANAPAFEDAVKTARSRDHLGVGIHFVLTRLRPVSDVGKIPELACENGSLPSGPATLLRMALSRRGVREEIKKELLAQAERVFDSGITPTHFDSHKHVHIIPAVLEAMIEIARRWSVKWIRDPFEAPGALRFLFDVEKDTRGKFLGQYATALCTSPARPAFRSLIRRSGIGCPDFFHGVSATGLITPRFIRHLADTLRPGVNELMTHPGYLDEDLQTVGTRLLDSRETEKKILSSIEIKRLFDEREIILSNFGEVSA